MISVEDAWAELQKHEAIVPNTLRKNGKGSGALAQKAGLGACPVCPCQR
jgi:hypothetical protein